MRHSTQCPGVVQEFMGQQSSFEGAAAGGASAGMDASRFWDVLRDTLGVEMPRADAEQPGADAMSESSDSEGFYADGASEADSDDADMQPGSRAADSGAAKPRAAAPRSAGDAWEAATATDSDDGDESDVNDDEFMAEYDQAMNDQLRGTRMADTFDKLGGAGSQRNDGKDRQGGEEQMRPVDVDLNLVSSLLESVASQQGMSGPASNLAAMLGLALPGADVARG